MLISTDEAVHEAVQYPMAAGMGFSSVNQKTIMFSVKVLRRTDYE